MLIIMMIIITGGEGGEAGGMVGRSDRCQSLRRSH